MRSRAYPAPLLALLLPLLLCWPGARPHVFGRGRNAPVPHEQVARPTTNTGAGCGYAGAEVSAPAAAPCLRCRCARGVLLCYLRVCPPLPDPPPPRCVLHLRRGDCCEQLVCEGGCVHSGALYAAGSAMDSSSPCEHCFCIGGRRRCVRPSCLPPPAGCAPRAAPPPAPPSCCPQSYDCSRPAPPPPPPPADEPHAGCTVHGRLFPEGERVPAGRGLGASACDNCFCMRGLVRCMAMSCAPALLGCRPVIRPGECCAHSYACGSTVLDNSDEASDYLAVTDNFLASVKNEDRSFHSELYEKTEPTSINNIESTTTAKLHNIESTTTAKLHNIESTTTAKLHDERTGPYYPNRKNATRQSLQSVKIQITEKNNSKVKDETTTSEIPTTRVDFTSILSFNVSNYTDSKTTAADGEPTTTAEPHESVKIVINGTINCTSEFSTSSLPINNTKEGELQNDTEARIRNIDKSVGVVIEDHAFNPNDIITERTANTSNDDNDTSGVLRVPQEGDNFMVNVSTFVTTNSTPVTLPPIANIPVEIKTVFNISTKKKDDYDYDYGDATLPPSLPNLKIIPFVAADAVFENAAPVKSKGTYPLLEREDTSPVYFPGIDHSISNYSTIKEDAYIPTQFPVYSAHKLDTPPSSDLRQDLQLTGAVFSAFDKSDKSDKEVQLATHSSVQALVRPLLDLDDYTVVTAYSTLESTESPMIDETSFSTEYDNFITGPHSVNQFSPPIETEGGFLPKEPPMSDDYYASHAEYAEHASAPRPHAEYAEHASAPRPHAEYAEHASAPRPHAEYAEHASAPRPHAEYAEHASAPRPHAEYAEHASAPRPHAEYAEHASAPRPHAEYAEHASAPRPHAEYAEHASAPRRPAPAPGGALHATSINFDKHKECVTSDGRRVPPGGEASARGGDSSGACARCVCTRGVLLCAEPACPPPAPGCRLGAPRAALCCPLLCDTEAFKSTESSQLTSLQPDVDLQRITTLTDDIKQDPFSYFIRTDLPPNSGPPVGIILAPLIQTAKDNTPSNATNNTKISNSTAVQRIQMSDAENTKLPKLMTSITTSTVSSLSTSDNPVNMADDELLTDVTKDYGEDEHVEEEEEEDEGFSFGSVLKLLLSDNYDSATTAPSRERSTAAPSLQTTVTATSLLNRIVSSTVSTPQVFNTVGTTDRPAYTESPTGTAIATSTTITTTTRSSPSTGRLPSMPLAVRGDHLVLGEVSSIRRQTERSKSSPRPSTASTGTTARPEGLGEGGGGGGPRDEENLVITNNFPFLPFREKEKPPSVGASGFGGGLLKLAGCNIYGRMYRVGRIISELSSACLQCMCTELGVQCRPLHC